MNTGRMLGVVVFVLGVTFLIFAHNSSEAPVDQLCNTLTGRYTDSTMWYIFAGAAAVVIGGFLAAFGKRI